MRHLRLAWTLAFAVIGAAAIVEAQGKPATVPVGPPSTPVENPTTPPADPADSLIDRLCAILPVPYLCD